MFSESEVRPGLAVVDLNLVGGALCLDFANTVEGREGDERHDAIRTPRDLLLWAQRAGVGSGDGDSPDTGSGPLERRSEAALDVREAIYRVFTAIVRRQAPDTGDVGLLEGTYLEGLASARLALDEANPVGHYTWRWDVDAGVTDVERDLDILRWRVAQSAIELLQRGRLDRLRQCPGGGEGPCNWLFIDTTKGGNRRWCSMADCGGRAKWRRQNARRRKR